MRIGELSKKAGVNIQTVRFYERQRLLRAPQRTVSGYRSYTSADLDRLRFIKQSQQLGFTLKEINELIDLHGSVDSVDPRRGLRAAAWRKAVDVVRQRLELVDQKVRLLQSIRRQLVAALADVDDAPAAACPALKRATRSCNVVRCPASSKKRA